MYERKTICKVRGIYLDYNASQPLNCNETKDIILRGKPGDVVTVHNDKKIERKRQEGLIQGMGRISYLIK